MKSSIKHIIRASIETKQKIVEDPETVEAIEKAVDLMVTAFRGKKSVLFCGNGGSAADAQHLAAELSGRFYKDRSALPAEALHCNTSYLTAVANDYGYDEVYARLVDGVGKQGDILVGLSTSGKSVNIKRAFEVARIKGMITIGLTGQTGGDMISLTDLIIRVPSTDPPHIQESHIMIGHIICQLVEAELFA